MKKNLVIIGVGNILYGDDGLGIHAINRLRCESLPSQVKILDGGTAGIDLLYLIEGADYALIVDCLDAGAEPGAMFRVPWEEIAGDRPDEQIVSLHDFNLWAVLSLAEKLGNMPKVVIFGVQPGNIELGAGMSPPVNKALPLLINSIKQEILNVYSIT
ncbi:MAG: hydrogenase maturation protease [Peptococcaceae bacterium]|nr:hydrogenase maturation protease [Peptococcaceae bacterium]